MSTEGKRKLAQSSLSFGTLPKVSKREDGVRCSSIIDLTGEPQESSRAKPERSEPARPHRWSLREGVREGTLIALNGGTFQESTKVAGFDLDGTLVNTKSGGSFARHADDWKLFNEHVKSKLKQLHEDGYRLVIFSNQNGIKKAVEGKKADQTKKRIDNFIREVGVPMEAFCAPQKDEFRKPDTGMWTYLVSSTKGDIEPMAADSIYVGDAAGQPNGCDSHSVYTQCTRTRSFGDDDVLTKSSCIYPGRPNDHSDCDKEFAANVGLRFYLPEEFFTA
eukprot:9466374-Pyramimonas_sp.AAC.1